MRNVDIKIFTIAKTQVNRAEVQRWLDHLGASDYEIPEENATSDPALLIALAAKRCYLSFQPSLNPNIQKVRKDLAEYLDNILKSGHGSVLEHAVYTFAIEGVSRVFTGEMNRHRAGVGISEGSMRYIRYQDIPWWMPPSMKALPDDTPDLAWKKEMTRHLFAEHFEEVESTYTKLQAVWKDELAPESKFHGKKQITSMLRRIIPMGVATGGVWTMNLRAVRHIITMRASEAAEEEIAYVFTKIAKIMIEEEPMLLGDFTQDAAGFYHPKHVKV
jgi:thymidylate synthase (FAD)